MVTEAIGRLVWEVWRLTHEAAGVFPPTFEALPANVRAWWVADAVPAMLAAYDEASQEATVAMLAHRTIMDAGLPEGAPFTVADVQPWILLPTPTRAAWTAMTAVAVATRTVSARASAVLA